MSNRRESLTLRNSSIARYLCSERGQALPYFLIMVLILIMCWAMILNIGKLTTDRIMLQNDADNAALSTAVLRARILNVMGAANYLKGMFIGLGAFPAGAHVNTFNQRYTGFPGDRHCTKGYEFHDCRYDGVMRLRFLVRALDTVQTRLMDPVTYRVLAARVARDVALCADDIGFLPGGAALPIPYPYPKAIEGLTRNSRGIRYYKTANWGATLQTHAHCLTFEKYSDEARSWFCITDPDAFSDTRVTVLAVKHRDAAAREGYPLFGTWFGISWPEMYAVGAAAAYNTRGPMFPEKENDSTGVPGFLAPVVMINFARQTAEMYNAATQIAQIPDIGPPVAAALGASIMALTAVAAGCLYDALHSTETPVKAYETAKEGGWDAHLVPAGLPGMRH